MKYDRRIHMTTVQLADLLGIEVSRVATTLAKEGAPRSLGKKFLDNRHQSIYDRAQVIAWLKSKETPEPKPEPAPKYQGEIVPASDWNRMERKAWAPAGRLADNFARAAQVYPHRIRSQGVGIGNGAEGIHGFGRGR